MSVWGHGGMLDAGGTISTLVLGVTLDGHFRPKAVNGHVGSL